MEGLEKGLEASEYSENKADRSKDTQKVSDRDGQAHELR
jgi:hypothetical protein